MGKQPFDDYKASLQPPPKPEGHRRIWLHLFTDQDALASWVTAGGGKGKDFDDPWEPGAYTDDYDDIYCSEYPQWRNRLGIGTEAVCRHELRHIFLNGPDEDGVRNDNDEHHRFLRCAALGLCVGADHGARFLPAHTGGVPRSLAHDLLDTTRMQGPDENGVRHGWVDVPEQTIWAKHA